MVYDELKTMMEKYLHNFVDFEEFNHLFDDSPIIEHRIVNRFITGNRARRLARVDRVEIYFPHLHKCILMVKKYPLIKKVHLRF